MKYDFKHRGFIETSDFSHKLALIASDIELKWCELQQKTELLSAILESLKIPKGNPILIYGHKEHLMVVAILACYHQGITYVPMDVIYPLDRIKKVIDQTEAQVLINCTPQKLDIDMPVVINHDYSISGTLPAPYHQTDNLLKQEPAQYIMFTSGSTGVPKGVQITHSSILTFIEWTFTHYGFNAKDVFMNQAPFTFDISLCDLLLAFSHGATLVLTNNELAKDQIKYLHFINQHQCTVWTSTPSFAYLFLRNPDFNAMALPHVHTFLLMGEALPNRTCVQLKGNFNEVRILNAYGPTEASIVTTLMEITPETIANFPLLPVGYVMPGVEILVKKENEHDKSGELIIVGDNVSIGYLNNEVLNQEKFYRHEGKQAFRTGDQGYYENGLLFCLGRSDDQIKMHGFRIELDEISSIISEHELISNTVTVALKRNEEVKKLVSFVIIKKDIPKTELLSELKPFISQKLPHYMIPSDIVIVQDFKYNTSHKIDKNAMINDYITQKLN